MIRRCLAKPFTNSPMILIGIPSIAATAPIGEVFRPGKRRSAWKWGWLLDKLPLSPTQHLLWELQKLLLGCVCVNPTPSRVVST